MFKKKQIQPIEKTKETEEIPPPPPSKSFGIHKFKHDDCHKIYEQVLFYEQEKFSLLSKLYAATILVKKDSEKTNELSENWWNIVQSYTCRDQISLSYSLWKTKITPYVFSLNILEKNPYFNRRPHSTSLFYHLKKKIKYSLRSLKLK